MQVLNIQWKWTVPNGLSLLRLALIPTFAVLYLCRLDVWALVVLGVSGLTDCFDGMLARKLNQVTDCGKLLDPLADKLTQVTVAICLTVRHPSVLPLAVICFGKELTQAIGGIILLRRHNDDVRGALWFGKVSTTVFYLSILTVILFDYLENMPPWATLIPVAAACCALLFAFGGYWHKFNQIRAEMTASAHDNRETGKENAL